MRTIEGSEVIFICNSDLSGDVEIQYKRSGQIVAVVPGEDLRLLFSQTIEKPTDP